MCREKRKLPIGIENFEQIIKDDFYYVDKTGLISGLLRNWGMLIYLPDQDVLVNL